MKQEKAHSRTPQPAIQPSSETAFKSASIAAKNENAVVTAAVKMLGPTCIAVLRFASKMSKPAWRSWPKRVTQRTP